MPSWILITDVEVAGAASESIEHEYEIVDYEERHDERNQEHTKVDSRNSRFDLVPTGQILDPIRSAVLSSAMSDAYVASPSTLRSPLSPST